MERKDFIIIGSGPAGLSAAVTAARYGVDVTVLGEDSRVGGQIFRQPPPPLKYRSPLVEVQDKSIFEDLCRQINDSRIRFLGDTTGWGLFDNKVVATDRPGSARLQADHLLIAEGAQETPTPFPGWTLPGVMSVGGAQILLKSQGIVPDGNIVVAGSGPLLLYTASQLLKNGARVTAVLEASPFRRWAVWSSRLMRAPDVLALGMRYLWIIQRHGVPVRYGRIVRRAEGDDRLREIVYSRTDGNWKPIDGTDRRMAADTLLMNFGFLPSTRFTHQAGCRHRFDPDSRSWIPEHDERFRTSLENVYVAGDGTGIAGVKTAVLEGRIVGLEVASKLGRLPAGEGDAGIAGLQRRLKRRRWYAGFLRDIYRFRPGLLDLITDDTVVCRCEEVRSKTIADAIESGERDLERIKLVTRAGLGRCQGRFCYTTLLSMILQADPDIDPRRLDFTGRPPVKPVPIKRLFDPDPEDPDSVDKIPEQNLQEEKTP